MSTTATPRGTIAIPEAPHRMPATPMEDIDKVIAEVRAQKDAWVALDIPERIAIIDEMIADTLDVSEEWVRLDIEGKGEDLDADLAEGWFGPVLLIRNLRILKQSLQDILEHGRPKYPGEATIRANGQIAVEVFPASVYDRVTYGGFTAEVWMEQGETIEEMHAHQARLYRGDKDHEGKVALVLGAGNVSAIPPMDAISKLFTEDQVVVLKMNPVNEHIGPVFANALRALVDRGFLRFVYGGAEEGSYLTQHDGIDEIHITGSDKTFEAIVFGPGEEGRRRKENREPILDKPITAELGSVTPVIVVPGPWSDKDIAFQAENLATMLVNNAGFNCIATRNIVTHRDWARRRDLLDGIREVLRELPDRNPYYPGARQRWEEFVAHHPEAERFGSEAGDAVPWTLIADLDPSDDDEICFTTEAFNGVFGEVPLDAPRDVPAFIDEAVEFCNEKLWGTLGASIIIHPRSLKDPAVEAALERAIENLHYGSIAVNHWSGIAYAIVTTPWGGAPGHDIYDIQSGKGFVHNFYMFDRPEKSVVRGPFRMPLKPPWFATHGNAAETIRRLAELEANPSFTKVAPLAWAAMRG